jgi:hypothetical protein
VLGKVITEFKESQQRVGYACETDLISETAKLTKVSREHRLEYLKSGQIVENGAWLYCRPRRSSQLNTS